MARDAEARAVARLRAAQAAQAEVEARFVNWAYLRGSEADLAKLAAHNELQTALFPFLTGKYPHPEKETAP